jgi:hypothetical protein
MSLGRASAHACENVGRASVLVLPDNPKESR